MFMIFYPQSLVAKFQNVSCRGRSKGATRRCLGTGKTHHDSNSHTNPTNHYTLTHFGKKRKITMKIHQHPLNYEHLELSLSHASPGFQLFEFLGGFHQTTTLRGDLLRRGARWSVDPMVGFTTNCTNISMYNYMISTLLNRIVLPMYVGIS